VVGTLLYKDQLPYNGKLVEDFLEEEFKDGKLIKRKVLDLLGGLKSEKKWNDAAKRYEGKVFGFDGAEEFTYTQTNTEDESFSGQVIQYIKGKKTNTLQVKDGLIVSGKIRLSDYEGYKETEIQNKWVVVKTYDLEGKLIKEQKELIRNTEEDYNTSLIFAEENITQYY